MMEINGTDFDKTWVKLFDNPDWYSMFHCNAMIPENWASRSAKLGLVTLQMPFRLGPCISQWRGEITTHKLQYSYQYHPGDFLPVCWDRLRVSWVSVVTTVSSIQSYPIHQTPWIFGSRASLVAEMRSPSLLSMSVIHPHLGSSWLMEEMGILTQDVYSFNLTCFNDIFQIQEL